MVSISNVQTGRPYDVMLDKEIADLAHQIGRYDVARLVRPKSIGIGRWKT